MFVHMPLLSLPTIMRCWYPGSPFVNLTLSANIVLDRQIEVHVFRLEARNVLFMNLP